MRQDTDVARMAAALRTPSLKYRSFGNEPVRNPPPAPPATEEQDFSALGDALAGAGDLSPDRVLGEPVPTETPMLPERSHPPSHPELTIPEASVYDATPSFDPVAPDPHAELHRVAAPVESSPPAAQPLPAAPAESWSVPPALPEIAQPLAGPPAPSSIPPAHPLPLTQEPAGQSLLQVLLGSQPVPAAVPPVPAPSSPVAAPSTAIEVRLAVSPQPVPAVSPALSMLSGLSAGSATAPSARSSLGTGSSLLDALMGFGPATGAATIHYPLLDALGDAMRGSTAEPSPRHWPADRVDIALPELLRRVAVGVRFARNAA